MRFTTPHGSFRVRLPWSWGAFDYSELCRLLWDQSDARFERALVKGRVDGGVRTDRGVVEAPLVVDALGWRRVLGSQPLAGTGGPLSRGLEVHPHGGGDELDVVIDRSLVRRGYCWRVPAGDEVRVGAGAYDPRVAVKQPTADDRTAFRRAAGPPPGKPHPASAAAGRGERQLLRRRLRRPLLRALGGRHPRRVLLRDRVRPRAAPRAGGRRDRGRGARVLQRLQRASSQRVLGHVPAPARHPRASAARAHRRDPVAQPVSASATRSSTGTSGSCPCRPTRRARTRPARRSGRLRRSRRPGRRRAPSGSQSRSRFRTGSARRRPPCRRATSWVRPRRRAAW